MSTTYLTNRSCVNNEKKCNYIKPYSNKDVKKLQFSNRELDKLDVEYNRVCSLNNGVQVETCNMDMNDMNKLTENEINYFNNIKKIYPYAKLYYTNDSQNRRNISKIELHKKLPRSDFSNTRNNLNVVVEEEAPSLDFNPVFNNLVEDISFNDTTFNDITPYILCKIKKNSVSLFESNPEVLVITDFAPDNYDNNCNNDIMSMETLLGTNHKSFSKKYTYYDDLKIINEIEMGYLDSVKRYLIKYRTVNHPLTHNNYNNRLIHIASRYNQVEIINLLISNNADLDIQNYKGETPSHLAVKYNCLECLKVLIRNGANIKIKDNNGRSCLFNAIENKNISILTFIYNNGVSLFERDNEGNNLVHHSLNTKPDINIIKFLIDRKVSLNEKNNDGKYPIELMEDKLNHKECKQDKNLYKNLLSIQSLLIKYSSIEENKYELVDVSQNVANYPVEFDTMVCYKPNPDYVESEENSPQFNIIEAKDKQDCEEKDGTPSYYDIENKNVSFQYIENKQTELDKINEDDLYLTKKGEIKPELGTYNKRTKDEIPEVDKTEKYCKEEIEGFETLIKNREQQRKSLIIALLILGLILLLMSRN